MGRGGSREGDIGVVDCEEGGGGGSEGREEGREVRGRVRGERVESVEDEERA